MVRPRLHAALWGRATLALRGWLGDPELEPQLAMIANDETPLVTRDRVELPFEWLLRVGAAGSARSRDGSASAPPMTSVDYRY